MSSAQQPIADAFPARPQGKFSLAKLGACLAAACLLGGLTAWIADIVQNDLRFSPFVLFPFLVGILLGMVMIGVVRVGQIGHRSTILFGTLVAAAIAVVGQHYQVYRRAVAEPEKFQHPSSMAKDLDEGRWPTMPGPPESLPGFLKEQAEVGRPLVGSLVARGGWAWLTWAVDGLLLLGAAIAIVYPVTRLPFCNGCGTWLRTIRSGRIDAATLQALAELAGMSLETEPKSGRYRLLSCQGGCSASNLVLIWEDASGATFTGEASLDSDARNRLMQIADAASANASEAEEPMDY